MAIAPATPTHYQASPVATRSWAASATPKAFLREAPHAIIMLAALTLAFVVGKSDSAAKVYEALRTIAHVTEKPANADDYRLEIERLKQRFTDLENQLKSSSTDEKQTNWYLVAATGVATIVSAFGDIFSASIMHWIGIAPVK